MTPKIPPLSLSPGLRDEIAVVTEVGLYESEEAFLVDALLRWLGRGEQESIALARDPPGVALLMNGNRTRQLAAPQGVHTARPRSPGLLPSHRGTMLYHHHVDELRHQTAPVLGIRRDLPALDDGPARHG